MDVTHAQGTTLQIHSFADRYPRFIYQDTERYNPIIGSDGRVLPATYLSGVDTKDSTYTVKGNYAHAGISFYPHALKHFFYTDAHELTDEMPDLAHFKPGSLTEQLHACNDHQDRITLLTGYLLGRLRRITRYDDPLVHDIIHHYRITDNYSISPLLERYNLQERQLERKFRNHIGISPKTYLRITRFEKAVARLRKGSFINLSDIAYELGYSDHSHFTREFREFSGTHALDFLAQEKLGQESSSFVVEA